MPAPEGQDVLVFALISSSLGVSLIGLIVRSEMLMAANIVVDSGHVPHACHVITAPEVATAMVAARVGALADPSVSVPTEAPTAEALE